MIQELVQSGVSKILQPLKKNWPCHVNRISSLADDCERRLFYNRSAWNKQPEIDDGLQGIFETGNKLEPLIGRIISEAGEAADPPFRIVGQQSQTKDKLFEKYQISGSIDGFLQLKEMTCCRECKGKQVNTEGEECEVCEGTGQVRYWHTQGVVDIKTSTPMVFRSLHDITSLNKYAYSRKYKGQLMLYSLAHNLDKCYIVFVNKANLYDLKVIEFDLDMEYAEKLLQKAQRINDSIEMDEPPEKINDPDVCPRCPFVSFCLPDYKSKEGFEVSDNDELMAVLDRLDELTQVAEELSELKKQRDALLVKGTELSVGNWLVTWKRIDGYRKPSEGKHYTQWRKKITRML